MFHTLYYWKCGAQWIVHSFLIHIHNHQCLVEINVIWITCPFWKLLIKLLWHCGYNLIKNKSITHYLQLHQKFLINYTVTITNYRFPIRYCPCINLLGTNMHIWLCQNMTIMSVVFKMKKQVIVCFVTELWWFIL